MTGAEVAPTRVRPWWVLTTLIPFGFVAPAGFAYAAPDLDGFSSVLMVSAWFGAFVTALVIRGQYVRRAGGAIHDPILLARRRVKERKRAQELVREEPEVARELGVGRPELPNAESMGVVDVNHASAEAMARVTGLDHDAVERIVATREEVRGFSSAEDLGHLLDLDPGVVERLRNVTVYVPR